MTSTCTMTALMVSDTVQFRALLYAYCASFSRAVSGLTCFSYFFHVAVVVMCRNQLYYFTALWPDTGDVAVDEADSK